MTADLVCALETAKYSSRYTLGIIKVLPNQDELLRLLLKHMILAVLDDLACYSEYTALEKSELEGVLVVNS
jgi:hypothetical protein